jgi:hypothetical protein
VDKRLRGCALTVVAVAGSSLSWGAADDDRRELAWLYDRLTAPKPSFRVAAARDLLPTSCCSTC